MKKIVSLLILAVMLLCSCGGAEYTDRVLAGREDYVTLRMSGTYSSGQSVSEEDYDRLAEGCARIVAEHDGVLSSHDEKSHVYALNTKVNMIMSPSETLVSVLTLADNMTEITDGAFLHTIGALTEAWSGDEAPTKSEIKAAKRHIDAEDIEISERAIEKADKKLKLDLDAIANGYTVQKLVERLSEAGLSYGVVSLGETVGVFGTKPSGDTFKVGICDPADRQKSVGYLHIESGFVSVAGTYQESRTIDGETYSGIIDPATGYPVDNGLVSVAVWSSNGAVADALSTALMVMGQEKALSFYAAREITFEAVMISENGEIILTDGLKDGIFELQAEMYSAK